VEKPAEWVLPVLVRALMKIVHKRRPSPAARQRSGNGATVGNTSEDGEYCVDSRAMSEPSISTTDRASLYETRLRVLAQRNRTWTSLARRV